MLVELGGRRFDCTHRAIVVAVMSAGMSVEHRTCTAQRCVVAGADVVALTDEVDPVGEVHGADPVAPGLARDLSVPVVSLRSGMLGDGHVEVAALGPFDGASVAARLGAYAAAVFAGGRVLIAARVDDVRPVRRTADVAAEILTARGGCR